MAGLSCRFPWCRLRLKNKSHELVIIYCPRSFNSSPKWFRVEEKTKQASVSLSSQFHFASGGRRNGFLSFSRRHSSLAPRPPFSSRRCYINRKCKWTRLSLSFRPAGSVTRCTILILIFFLCIYLLVAQKVAFVFPFLFFHLGRKQIDLARVQLERKTHSGLLPWHLPLSIMFPYFIESLSLSS